MDTDTIAKIMKLEKSVEEAKVLQSEIRENKQKKARLERDIEILQRTKTDEQAQYEQDKSERASSISKLNASIEQLEAKRVNLATSTAPEINRLTKLKKEVTDKQGKLDRDQLLLDAKSDRVAKDQVRIDNKKEAIKQIKELCDRI